MSFPKYPEYKDSGIKCLGKIPRDWPLSRLKVGCQVIPSNVDKHSKPDEVPVWLCNYTDVYYNDLICSKLNFMSATASPSEFAKFSLKAGDVIITKDSETADDIAIPAFVPEAIPGIICGYHLSIIRPRERTFGRYVHYLFQSAYLRAYFEVQARGLTRVGISQSALGNAPVPLPRAEEQRDIADFLDQATAKIDALIEEQQRLIELLKEKRQAVISHAVTKGLDPDAPMKDSGVEWLGEVPAHWEALKTKHLFRLVAEPAPADNDLELLSVYAEIGVRPRKDLEQRGNKASTTDGYWVVRKGDIVVNKLLAWMGAVGYSDFDGVTSPAYDILRPIRDLSSRFFHYIFRSQKGQQEFKRRSRGLMDMRLRLYFDELGGIPMPFPPAEEQRKIVKHIEKVEGAFDELIEAASHQIELLLERRSALISAAVTGKIDVRNWQSQSDTTDELPMAADKPAIYETTRS